MSVATDAVLGHPSPWTIEDVEALPESGNHARYEILTPGVLTVSPAPGFAHQCASFNLTEILRAAARAAGRYVGVVQGVNVEISNGRLAIPDIAVVDGHVAEAFPVRCQPSAVHLVIEIVSPGSRVTDRAIKPELYASARIPFYWRLELAPIPRAARRSVAGGQIRRLGSRPRRYARHAACTFPGRIRPRRPVAVAMMSRDLGVIFKPVLDHGGDWTIEAVEALPDLGGHARYEILEPGVLTISPPLYGTMHQRAAGKLQDMLGAAVQASHLDLEVLTVLNVEIPNDRLATPDVVVADIVMSNSNASRLPPDAVHLVVEIVSPSSEAVDRLLKPGLYADARIPFYWRLELEPAPTLFPYVLSDDRYLELPPLAGGVRSAVPAPFPVEVDPAELLRR